MMDSTVHSPGGNQTQLSVFVITQEHFLLIMFISLGIICQMVSVFGTISNILNMIVFIRQGFTESINICLFALSVSDFFSLVCIMWSGLCFTPMFRDADIPLVTDEVHTISGTWPHVTFTRVTGWITAFISFERCMCVTIPLKVKYILTPIRHVVAMVTIFTITLGCSSLAYISLGLDWKFYPERNRTLVGLVFHLSDRNRKTTDAFGFAINGVFVPLTCFVITATCTVLLIIKLNQQTAWRNTHSSTSFKTDNEKIMKKNIANHKEQKAALMVVMISAVFIASFLPAVGIFIAGYAEPQLSYDGLYRNLFVVNLSISFTTEAINSSINILIYFTMNTKYKKTFLNTFALG